MSTSLYQTRPDRSRQHDYVINLSIFFSSFNYLLHFIDKAMIIVCDLFVKWPYLWALLNLMTSTQKSLHVCQGLEFHQNGNWYSLLWLHHVAFCICRNIFLQPFIHSFLVNTLSWSGSRWIWETIPGPLVARHEYTVHYNVSTHYTHSASPHTHTHCNYNTV